MFVTYYNERIDNEIFSNILKNDKYSRINSCPVTQCWLKFFALRSFLLEHRQLAGEQILSKTLLG